MNETGVRRAGRASWGAKFGHALRGLWKGVRGQSSFAVHLPVGGAAIAAGLWFQIERWEWCVVLLCIGGVLAAELVNSALESLARAVDEKHNPKVGAALDIAAAAVLVAAVSAVVLGSLVFWPYLRGM